MQNIQVINSILIFIVSSVFIYSYKPSIIFKKEGGVYSQRDYGIGRRDGHKKTLFTYNNVIILVSLFSWIISSKLTQGYRPLGTQSF
jgi:hypothetical protein